ncbi:IS5 family transposase [Sciscionella marina]|uniref:IS5 family transposase n=1 Tax=Sciscionella marina TaxID=508770 RepID=UPI0023E262F5|nr:IS5 family transposase [Sciscionella marina]
MASVAATGRADLTDAQWAILEPLLPVGKKPGRPPTWTKRQLINGIRWRVRVGCPWRDIPAAYGCWQTVYGLFRRWQRAGFWALIVAALQTRADAVGLITWEVSVDSTINRAHQHAAGARTHPDAQKQPPGGVGEPEPVDGTRANTRSSLATTLKRSRSRRGCSCVISPTRTRRGVAARAGLGATTVTSSWRSAWR